MSLLPVFFRDFSDLKVIHDVFHPSKTHLVNVIYPFWCDRRSDLEVNWSHDGLLYQKDGDDSS